jgi:hypothetical protein
MLRGGSLKNAAVWQRRKEENMDIVNTRNSINHVILNRIMTLRYQLRKRPALLQCIMSMEALFVRTGVIFYGRSQKRLHGKG